MSRRIFAIGDVHGCAHELELLIAKIKPKPEDLVVFLGDYVDRGPASRKVIDLVIELGSRCEVVALKGNHEAMFLDFLQHPESPGAGLFVLNGGSATLANYAQEDGSIEMPDKHVAFFRDLKLFYETDDYFFVHAGVPDIPLKSIRESEHELAMLWSRHPFLGSDYKWEKIIVHGHTPVTDYELKSNRINIDTGCVYDGKLTALELPALKFHQVDRDADVKSAPLFPREFESSRISMRYSGRLSLQASRGAEKPRAYETLNYNQFGMLMRDALTTSDYALMNGDVIEGVIGDSPDKEIAFTGTVVRCEARGGFVVYGVRIDKIKSDGGNADGFGWIERPHKP
jgi:serine/threonine protein phosphatase 1